MELEPKITLEVQIFQNRGCCLLVSPKNGNKVGWVPMRLTAIDDPKQKQGEAKINIPLALAIKRGFVKEGATL